MIIINNEKIRGLMKLASLSEDHYKSITDMPVVYIIQTLVDDIQQKHETHTLIEDLQIWSETEVSTLATALDAAQAYVANLLGPSALQSLEVNFNLSTAYLTVIDNTH